MLKSRFAQTIIALLIIILAAAYVTYRFSNSIQSSAVDHLMDGFRRESVETRFLSFATTVAPLKRLELAKLNQIEILERSSQPQLFWKTLNLPEVVVRATVPVEYRYYVEINDKWQVKMENQVLTMIAPALFAGTPSPDISQLQFEVRKGSFFRNEKEVARALQNEISGLLQKRGAESVALVRETARLQVKSIARQWLLSESKQAEIKVQFADELRGAP